MKRASFMGIIGKSTIILLALVILLLCTAIPIALAVSETQVCTAEGDQSFPVISDGAIVWQDDRNAATTGEDVYMWDPVHGERAICTNADVQIFPAISGNTIVWADGRNFATTEADIYMWDPVNGERVVCNDPGNQVNPAVYGCNIVWVDCSNISGTDRDIYMWEPIHGKRVICNAIGNQVNPAISGGTIVWADDRNSSSTGYDIYMWDPINGERVVCNAPGNQLDPAISGNTIVWDDARNLTTGYDIYMWDPQHGERAVCTDGADQLRPKISGNTIVWTDSRNLAMTGADIYMWNPAYGERVVCNDLGDQLDPVISNSTIAWMDNRNSATTGWDIYMVTLDITPPVISVDMPAEGAVYTLGQIVLANWAAVDDTHVASTTGTVPSGSAIDTRTVGAKEFTVTATDNAGNSNMVTRHYTVAYAYTAISPGKTTSVNAGSSLSVKIQLKDYNGNNVANAVAKLNLSMSTTSGWAPEQNATSKSNPYNYFSYTMPKGQYVYNLDTKPLSPGTWQLRISLDDGTLHTMNVVVK